MVTVTKKPTTENALEATLADMRVRTVVEDTVKSMLVDVELAASLQKELTIEAEHKHLHKRALASEVALQEAKMIQEEEKERTTSLADELVQELWSLSQELGSLKRWKRQHEGTVEERDNLVARLLQAEDQIEELRARPATVASSTSADQLPTENKSNLKEAPKPAADNDEKADELSPKPLLPVSNLKEAPVTAEEPEAKEEEKVEETISETPGSTSAISTESTTTTEEPQLTPAPAPAELVVEESPNAELKPAEEPDAAVVSLVLDDGDAPQLETFEEPVLLQIFAFLDALEIVNLAQVNIALYSRVDFLFGIGDDESAVPTPVPTEVETPTHPTGAPEATIVQLPPPLQKKAPPLSQKKAPPEIQPQRKPAPAPAPGSGGIISLFQTSRPQQSATARPAAKKAPTPSSTTTPTPSKQPLSAAMANSMAEKLTDKEINAIISMTEKLNQRNKEVDQLTAQNLTLHGQLDGTQAVKEFLVNKVRDMEQTLTKTNDVERKTTQQIASDQEVIAFLDSRVRELEHQERIWAAEKKSLSDQLVHVQVQTEQKITVLSDMLQYERERGAENERDWKATRKVLVKEVKSCRSQIWTMQAETMGLQEQNDRLKRAVLASGVMHNGSGG